MCVLCLIPARSGSKGVPDKNIIKLSGHPLIAYSICAALKTIEIDRVVLSTDSEKYADIGKNYRAEVPFLRPERISQDNSTDYEFIIHALNWFKNNERYEPQYIVHLRPTTPFRDINLLNECIKIFKKTDGFTSLRSVHEMSQSAYKMFEIEDRRLKNVVTGSFNLDDYNIPRQEFKKTYDPNGYIDILKTEYILKNNKIHGDKVFGYITPRSYEIDSPDDFRYFEYLTRKNSHYINELFRNVKNGL